MKEIISTQFCLTSSLLSSVVMGALNFRKCENIMDFLITNGKSENIDLFISVVGTLSGFTWFKHPWVDLGTRRVLKGRVQTFSWKILSLQQFTFESRKGWDGGKG